MRDDIHPAFFLGKQLMSIRYNVMLIVAVVLCVYYPAMLAPLNSVDDPGMYSYLLNTDAFTLKSVFLPGGSGSYYRPLLLSSFLIDKYVWGLEEPLMHLNNILIHMFNALLVYSIVSRALIEKCTKKSYFPLLASILFALHPINTESVAWISGRTDALAAFFLLLSARFLFNSSSVFGSFMSSMCLLLACLSKETAIFFLPAAIIFPFYYRLDKTNPTPLLTLAYQSLHHIASFIIVGVGYFVIRTVAFSQGDQGVARVMTHVGGDQGLDKITSFIMMLKAIGFYCKKLIMPFPLNFGIVHVSDVYIFVGIVFLVLFTWLVTHRTLPAFFFLCAVSVASSALLIILIRFTWTPLAERYMYIPSSFFIIGVILSVEQWQQRIKYNRLVALVAVSLVVIAFCGSFTRNLLWQDNLAFFKDTLKNSPNFMPAQSEIAAALKKQGKLQEALVVFNSIKNDEDIINYQYGMINKAGAIADSGDYTAAYKILNDVLRTPGKLEIQILEKMMELNRNQVMQGKSTASKVYADSVIWLTRLYTISGNPFYHYRLGVIHLHEKKYDLALKSFDIVTKTAPPAVYYRKPAEKLAKELSM